jgi:HEPN domain-containing protein
LRAVEPALHSQACFQCQQSAEKYLKAMVQELGLAVTRTHNLVELLKLLVPHDTSLKSLERGLDFLTRFAVEFRYPGETRPAGKLRQPFAAPNGCVGRSVCD